jgi:phosphoglycerate dehydrogenase-like enzyme
MSEPNSIRVICLGFVFDPIAQRIIQNIAPPQLQLSFAENPDASTATLVSQADMLLCVSPVTEQMIAGAPRLRLIHKWGIGVDKIDLEAAERHGVYVAITAGANASVIAEHAVLLMLAVLRRVTVADRSMREGKWSAAELRPKSRQMAGKTVGIIGFGNIGRAVAVLLQGFQTTLLYHDPRGTIGQTDPATGAKCVTLEDLLATSDIVTLHCPGGPNNHHILNQKAIAAMKPGSIVINAARGELIAEPALVDALSSGHLLGAGLDVFEQEPLSARSKLRALDSVVMTPHSAGGVLDHVEPMAAHAFENMLRMLRGELPREADLIVTPAHPRFTSAKVASP